MYSLPNYKGKCMGYTIMHLSELAGKTQELHHCLARWGITLQYEISSLLTANGSMECTSYMLCRLYDLVYEGCESHKSYCLRFFSDHFIYFIYLLRLYSTSAEGL